MSGGSMDYVCYRVEDAASMTSDPEFSDLLRDAARVLHAEEWYRSCDTTEQDYLDALRKFKRKWFESDRAERLRSYIDKELEQTRKRCYSLIGEKAKGGTE